MTDQNKNWHECPYCLEDMTMSAGSPRKIGKLIERLFFCRNTNCEVVQITVTTRDNQK